MAFTGAQPPGSDPRSPATDSAWTGDVAALSLNPATEDRMIREDTIRWTKVIREFDYLTLQLHNSIDVWRLN